MSHPRRPRLLSPGVIAGLACAVAVGAVLLMPPARQATAVAAVAQRPAAATMPHRTPSIAFLGDSWTEGVGGTNHDGYAPRTASLLGWRFLDFGVGGSGYTQPGAHHNLFAQRIAAVVASHPDVIVVQGSLNDAPSTPTAESSASYTTLRLLRTEADPRTPIIVLGASYNPGTPNATIDWINAAVQGSATRLGLPFINPAPLNWVDAGDPTLWFDRLHPDDSGHQRIADHLAPLLRALVGADPQSVR